MNLSDTSKEALVDYMVSKGAVRSVAETFYDEGLVTDYRTADMMIPEAKF